MQALVTGGAGFIGRALVAELLDQGSRVVVVDSGDTGTVGEVPDGAEVIERDIGKIDESGWEKLMVGTDRVFHLAAKKYNTPDVTPEEMLKTNVEATWKIAEASAKARVSRLVFTSSLYAYGSLGPEAMRETDVPLPTTLYGASKLMGEHILRTIGNSAGLNWSCARLFFIYGPGQHAEGGYKSVIVSNFSKLRDGLAPTICGDGEQSLDYVFVSDAVSALLSLSEHGKDSLTVNVASGRPLTINSLTAMMQLVAGTSMKPLEIEADWTAGSKRFGDPSTAFGELGWAATTDPVDGLRLTWESLGK